MPLTDAAVRNAKPKEKSYKLFDGNGLYIEIVPAGGKWWRFKYRIAGKEKRLSLGVYPDVSLKEARDKHVDARKNITKGIDPSETRKAVKATASGENTFEAVAREWHAKFTAAEWSDVHSKNIMARLTKKVFPWLGSRPVGEISAPEILSVFRRVEECGHLETLHRTLADCGCIFRYAIATSRATVDPTYRLGEAFPKPFQKNFSAITDPEEVGKLLRAIDAYHGTFIVKCALQLAPLVFLRSNELRLAEWSEFDLDRSEWIIPIARMKRTRRDKESLPKDVHVVFLAPQAVALLRQLYQYTGNGRLVFPGLRGKDRAISDATLTNALRRMGYSKDEIHVHGFRAMAKTMLKQELGFQEDVIERQLSHAVKGTHGKSYDRTTYFPERRKMMRAWADYLDHLKTGKADKAGRPNGMLDETRYPAFNP